MEAEDLTIPKFLRRQPGASSDPGQVVGETKTMVFLEPWEIRLNKVEPEELREHIRKRVRAGKASSKWLVASEYNTERDVELFVESMRAKLEERKIKEQERAEAAKKRLETVREMSPTHGMIPLRKILEEMGDKAPRRGHAKMAIDLAKLDHVKYHFPNNSPVTLARVKQVLSEYVPPKSTRAAKVEYDASYVIQWSGKNPKKEGTDAHGRWEKLKQHHGKTVGQYGEADGNMTTLKNALAKGNVTFKGVKLEKAEPKKEKTGESKARHKRKDSDKNRPRKNGAKTKKRR